MAAAAPTIDNHAGTSPRADEALTHFAGPELQDEIVQIFEQAEQMSDGFLHLFEESTSVGDLAPVQVHLEAERHDGCVELIADASEDPADLRPGSPTVATATSRTAEAWLIRSCMRRRTMSLRLQSTLPSRARSPELR